MHRVTFFGAVTIWLSLVAGNFAFQWGFVDAPNWAAATERSFFQAVALVVAWLVWRDEPEKVYRRGQGPGWCD